MLNFAVGPVLMYDETLELTSVQIPYFRTPEFSEIMLENEVLFHKLVNAPPKSRTVFITGSGTASMEAAVLNFLTTQDKVLIVNGGSFGQRFCDICSLLDVTYTSIICSQGKTLTREQLFAFNNQGYTALLVNLCETSTGVLYDIELISEFCKKNKLFLIIDAISSFLCDSLDMQKSGANVIITGSQKALALDPGLSMICMDVNALARVNAHKVRSLYFDVKLYLQDGMRGQTPYTPAVRTIFQLNKRLKILISQGGVKNSILHVSGLASYFRKIIVNLPFEFFADLQSNAVTSIYIKNGFSAYRLFEILKNNYQIFVCPNGGPLRDKLFRVGHMGNLRTDDYDTLKSAIIEILNNNNLS